VFSSNHTNGQCRSVARDETSIARSFPRLIRDLARAVGILAAVTGVDDVVAMVFVVDIPAGNDDRVGTFQLRAANAGLRWAMDERFMKLTTVDEELANPDPRWCAKKSAHVIPPGHTLSIGARAGTEFAARE
jgi:hypothetical protein